MKVAEVQISLWEAPIAFSCLIEEEIKVGDYVIIDNKDYLEMGKVIRLFDMNEIEVSAQTTPLNAIIRKANKEDFEVMLQHSQNKKVVFNVCRELIKKHKLPIKLVDVAFAFDDSRIVFAFIADGRVDFRELLKDLNKKFKKLIRLQQIGIRDEIKITGDIGCCGRRLCCQGFYKELGNVTSELAALQQIAHRGSERLSGVCGRLKCCLTYEEKLYSELAEKLPLIGEKVKTSHGRGEVIGWHVLKQTVDVLLEDGETIVEMPIEK